MRISSKHVQLAFLAVFAAGISTEAASAAEGDTGIPCAGVWLINEQATMRTTTQMGPSLQFFESWGPDGWMRMNTSDPASATFAEWHFEQFGDRPYQVFGRDPSLGKARKITDRIVEASRVRLGEPANSQYVFFSEDCSRVTMYKAEGEDRHAPPGQTHYYNDLRVYDKILPPAESQNANAQVAKEFFGGWELNRAASKLTLGPKESETVVIVPWENSGWVWNRLSGGAYQPEGVHAGVERVECGAASGPAAIACQGEPETMMLYWASWDAKPFESYGENPGHVRLNRNDERNFTLMSYRAGQNPASGDKASIMLSANGNQMIVTTESETDRLEKDVRLYDRIDGRTWPVAMQ